MVCGKKIWSLKQPERDRELGLETEEEYRKRWISIRIIYFNGFLIYVAFGNITTSAWPYLRSLDPEATKTFLSYVFGIPSVMQLLFSPAFGYWNNKLSSIRMPMLLFLVIYVIGNALYAILEEIPSHQRYVMLLSRAFVGIAFVCCTIYRAYVSTATTVAERTKTMSYLALAQAIGLLAGSVFQSLFALLGEEGYRVAGLFQLNMYTANGWICVVLGIINIILMMPGIFEDQAIAVKEAMKGMGMENCKDLFKSLELKYMATFLMVLAFGLLMFVYSAYQTLLSPIALDQFNWTNEESLFYLGILMTAGALVSCILFLLLDTLCKKFTETNVLVYGAMFALFLSQLFMIPVGKDNISDCSQQLSNMTTSVNSTGCPPAQEWCCETPPIGKFQFTIAYTLLCISFSIGTTLSQAVYSKLLGPRPQGTWMALLTCAGSVARILGPGSVSIYVLFGTYWTFGSGTIICGLVFLWMWIYRNRLQPPVVTKPEIIEELKVLNPPKLTQ